MSNQSISNITLSRAYDALDDIDDILRERSLHDPTLSPAEIRELVDLGHDVNGRNEEGETPLHVHVRGDVENVKALIEAGADVNLRKLSSPWGNDMTALHAAVDAEEPEAVKAVLAAGADVEATYSGTLEFTATNSWTYTANALHDACEGSSPEIVSLLIEAGANIDSRLDGSTPLLKAASGCEVEIIHLLLNAGAQVNVCNEDDEPGVSVLHYAVRELPSSHLPDEQKTKAVEAIIRAGADINGVDAEGNGPLHYAIHSPPIAELLIKAGADVFAKNAEGKTPIDCAREKQGRALEVLQSLERHIDLGNQWDRHVPTPTPAPVSRGRDRW